MCDGIVRYDCQIATIAKSRKVVKRGLVPAHSNALYAAPIVVHTNMHTYIHTCRLGSQIATIAHSRSRERSGTS